jgi:hypothetical protein
MDQDLILKKIETYIKLSFADLFALLQVKMHAAINYTGNNKFEEAQEAWIDVQALTFVIGQHYERATLKAERN